MRYILSPLLLLLLTSSAFADPKTSVHVLPHGGVRTLPTLEVDTTSAPPQVVLQGEVTVRPQGEASVVMEDAKVLPDGTFLLSNLSDQGVAIHDPGNGTTTFAYRNQDFVSNITSASVATYVGAGTPARILFTDAGISRAWIWDLSEDREMWKTSLFTAGASANVVQGIVMPKGRIAMAVNWGSAALYGVEIFTFNAGTGLPERSHRLANKEAEGQPDETVVNEALVDLREIMALEEDVLLITTRFSVMAMGLDGEVRWKIDVSETDVLSGELAGARALPSGHIAIATFEPGVWTKPHPNHRVHWFDVQNDTPTHIASSQALSAAPRRVLSAQGTGGTGTLGWSAGLGNVGQGELSQIRVSDGVSLPDDTYDQGDVLKPVMKIRNTGELPVTIPRLAMAAIQSSTCLDSNDPTFLILEERDLILPGLSEYTFDGEVTLGAEFLPGKWCIYPAIQDAQGVWTRLDSQTQWTFRAPGSNVLPTQDLGLVEGPEKDMSPDMDMGTLPPPSTPDPGCACATPSDTPPVSWPLTMLLVLGFVGRRWRGQVRA